MNISVSGIDSLLEHLDGLTDGLKTAVVAGMKDGLEDIKKDAVMNCPYGELSGSIQTEVIENGKGVSGRVYSTLNHAVYVEMGTGPKGEANHSGVAPVPVTYSPKGWVYHDETGFHGTRGQPARPFLYPAYRNGVKGLLEKIRLSVRKAGK
jgi:hypothetical protein